MAETKKKIPVFGHEMDAIDVPATEAKEFFNEYVLEDGTVLRVKGVATSFLFLDNQFLPDGRPVVICLMTPNVSVISSPKSKPGSLAYKRAAVKKAKA
jgi:hypothetical protein